MVGIGGHIVPIYFLHTFFPENQRWDRDLSKDLYAMDAYTRLCQEVLLGIGGVRMLRALGHEIDIFHMNEGHASFLTFERLKEENFDERKVIESCRFTTHTPIPAGHDRFDYNLATKVMGGKVPMNVQQLSSKDELHTTRLALHMSKLSNGVSKKHAEVCRRMFPEYHFLGITNGVHHRTWTADSMQKLFDKHLPEWRSNPYKLTEANKLPPAEVKSAFQENKRILIGQINKNPDYLVHINGKLREDDLFDENTLTIAFSRRFVPYKRPLLLFKDLNRLRDFGYRKLQIIYSGACNPGDEFCKNIFRELDELQKELRGQIRLAAMPDRNLDSTKILAAGSDIWLNNPEPPMEASGTSGMKAAMNGGINFSTPDGWWIEAAEMCPKGGWTAGCDISGHDEWDCDSIYDTLEEIIDIYYNQPAEWIERMKHSISLGGYFNTHRCLQEYLDQMWN
jgi:starch phosphorylase